MVPCVGDELVADVEPRPPLRIGAAPAIDDDTPVVPRVLADEEPPQVPQARTRWFCPSLPFQSGRSQNSMVPVAAEMLPAAA